MKLFVSDLDGTLLNSNKEITKYTKDTLNKLIEDGVNFTVATARTPATVVDMLDGVNIKLPAVMMNGVMLYDINEEKYIDIKDISNSTVNQVLDIFKDDVRCSFIYGIKDDHLNVYYKDLSNTQEEEFFNERCQKKQKTFVKVADYKEAIIGSKIINFIIFDKYEPCKRIYDKLQGIEGINVDLYQDIYAGKDDYAIEVYSDKASKANGIKLLDKYVDNTSLVCFGDNINDIPMFEVADESYAVENAVNELKDLSTGVIGSNNDNAVAKFILEQVK